MVESEEILEKTLEFKNVTLVRGAAMTKFISGLKHCHVPGLHSYVLRDRISDSEGMLRVFHNTGSSMLSLYDSVGEYMLAPHNHRQDITIYAIHGEITNVTFEVIHRSHHRDRHEYTFKSAIQGGDLSLDFIDTVEMKIQNIQVLHPADDGLRIPCADVHTVVAAPHTAWLVVEGAIAPLKHRPWCYTVGFKHGFDSDGLYRPMDQEELLGMRDLAHMASWRLAGISQ